jgi:UDP-N-acetylglucosamine/UDP-N-acetylgalactosamine diphosphorylase
MRQFARWLKLGGQNVAVDATGLPGTVIEVSPLFGYDEDSFLDSTRQHPIKSSELNRGPLYLDKS